MHFFGETMWLAVNSFHSQFFHVEKIARKFFLREFRSHRGEKKFVSQNFRLQIFFLRRKKLHKNFFVENFSFTNFTRFAKRLTAQTIFIREIFPRGKFVRMFFFRRNNSAYEFPPALFCNENFFFHEFHFAKFPVPKILHVEKTSHQKFFIHEFGSLQNNSFTKFFLSEKNHDKNFSFANSTSTIFHSRIPFAHFVRFEKKSYKTVSAESRSRTARVLLRRELLIYRKST